MSKKSRTNKAESSAPPAPTSSGGERNLAKTSRPRLAEICPRERLFLQLDEARSRPLVHISAPGGAGKTTLVASYLEARRLPCLWYQVQAEDSDVAGFFHYMSRAVQQAAPQAEPMPGFSAEFLPNLPVFAHRYFRELYGCFQPPFLMVLDDCHELPADSALHEVIRDGLAELPAGFNVVLISRNPPPPVLARLRLNQSVALLEWDALRLTADEAEAIVRRQSQGQWNPAPELLERLHARCEGWVAGLVLLVEWARKHAGQVLEEQPQVREIVFDYFAAELFAGSDPALQDFLLQTAFLPSMTEAMAATLTGRSDAPAILAGLHRSHYFTERRGGAPFLYRYHALFREFLLAQARQRFAPARLQDLGCRAAALLAENDQSEAAVDLLCAVGAWQALIPLLLQQAPALAAAGRLQILHGWLQALAPSLLDQVPWLRYWHGICCLAFDPSAARRRLEQAFQSFQACGDAAGLYLAWCGVMETIIWEGTEFARFDPWVQVYQDLQARHTLPPSPEIEARVTASLLFAAVWRLHAQADAWTEQAAELVAQDGKINLYSRIVLAAVLLMRYLWRGEFAKAGALVDTARSFIGAAAQPSTLRVHFAMMQAQYFETVGDHPACCLAVEEGLAQTRALGISTWDFQFYARRANSAAKAGRMEESRTCLEHMAAVLQRQRTFDVIFYQYQCAAEALCRGELDKALEHARPTWTAAEAMGFVRLQSDLAIWFAYIACVRGDHELAAQELARGRAFAQRYQCSPLIEFEYGLGDAQLALALGEAERGLELLEQALAQGRRRGYVSWPFCLPPLVLPLFIKALEAGIEMDYVRSVIRRHRWVPEQPPLEIEHWPWEIKIYTLGRFAVVKEGAELRFQAKAQSKPLDLLKALIALGGRDVHASSLIDALWPDSEGDTQKLFEITLHRLRKLLGCDEALLLSSGKLSLDARHAWVDIWPLERRMARLEALLKSGEGELESMADAVLESYQGHFLARDDEQPWMLATRQRLRSRLARSVAALGQHWQAAGRLDLAESLYRRGVECDPLAEEFYRGLMACYRDSGRTGEAEEVFRQCRSALATQLGLTPSAATLAVYHSLP